ncbi:MAG: hypothetical protein KAH56_14345 [Candidatus Krumholzibacteria bacterium]|nr:hypothetical protein [Candidatus Krumholzibacteria bacterium]
MFTFRRFFRPFLALISVLVIAIAQPVTAGDLPTLEQILGRYVEALGGRENLTKLTTRSIIGEQIDDRPYKGERVTIGIEAWADTTGAFSMVMHEAGGDRRTGSDDDHNAKLAFIFNPQGPLMIAKHFPNPHVTGTWDYDGKLYYKVENDLKFEYYTLYFEVETGMLTRIGYHWWLEDFRTVDGVLIPFIVVRGRKGGSTTLYLETVTHNGDVTEHLATGGQER